MKEYLATRLCRRRCAADVARCAAHTRRRFSLACFGELEMPAGEPTEASRCNGCDNCRRQFAAGVVNNPSPTESASLQPEDKSLTTVDVGAEALMFLQTMKARSRPRKATP